MKILRPYQKEVLDTLCTKLRETDYPLLVNASVGAGKSLIIAELLLTVERQGHRALCLTMNSTLISQNADAYEKQGGKCGIYCASLYMKDTQEPIIFASPMSVLGSIKKSGKLSKIPFNLIIVDECHNINVKDKKTTYMRIFNHYSIYAQTNRHKLQFIGLTGTPYRGKGYPIVGEDLFFKEEVCAITADWLIENQYLTPPIWGYCDKSLQYDFKELKVNSMGKFNYADLEYAVNKQPRLTAKIMNEVYEIVKNRKGAFIFASSIQHCYECAVQLPPEQTAIITGDTPDAKREEYIYLARLGIIKYLINVNVLTTGIDIPNFDTVVFVRPTESLVLYIQCLGRGLRLADDKTDCLILDYAGNLDRHGDIDNPIINQALQPKVPNDPEYCIECFECNSMNTLQARRCIGIKNNKRCEHWFLWRDCPNCKTQNDIIARKCRKCQSELIDPNLKLQDKASNKNLIKLKVNKTNYYLSSINGFPVFKIVYFIKVGDNKHYYPAEYNFQNNSIKVLSEKFVLNSDKSIRFFYHTVVKSHFIDPHDAYPELQNISFLKEVIQNGDLYSPLEIECKEDKQNQLKIVKKYFHTQKRRNGKHLCVIANS